jgi:hypothetical protein
VAVDGVTAADLREQYLHNLRMREMSAEVQRLQARLQRAGDNPQAKAILAKIVDQPIRYGKPGLATHIRYLAGMTSGADQKVGRDAIARANVLRKELDALMAETDRGIGK